MTARIAIAIALLMSGAPVLAQRTPDLDASSLPKADEPPDRGGIATGGRTSSWKGEIPIAVRLLAVEPRSCSWNEPITFDLEIRNVSRSTISLPWSRIAPDNPQPSSSATVFSTLMVSLRVADDPRASLGIVEALYGEPGNQLVSRRIRPNESVVVRFPATCVINFATAPRAISAAGSPVTVSALVTVRRGDTESPAVVKSNEIEIAVSRVDER
jgi:hypothetical protein